MLILRQSTSVDIRMGPFVDATDGVTPETGVTLGTSDQAEVLKADGAATVAMAGTFAAVTGCDGWYDYTVATGDVDTVGEVVFVVQDSSVCLPVLTRGYVVEEAVYDALYDSAAAGPLQSTTAGRTLDVTATGAAGIDWGNVENPTTTLDLSATSINLVDTTTDVTNQVSADVTAISGDTNAADNLELDYDGTGYSKTTSTIGTVTNVTNQVTADMTAISGDTTAADNLEAMYDGTGYLDSTAPASRSQVDSFGTASGGAINFEASSDNTAAAILGVTLVGTQTSGTYTDTEAEDSVYHQITHSGNAIDVVYGFQVGASRSAIEVDWKGYLTSGNDEITVQAYDFIGADWETRRTITGSGATNISEVIKLLQKHTEEGTGQVYVRFITSAQTSPVLNTDEILVAAVSTATSLGFIDRAVWVDTNSGTSGTGEGVGTASTPSDNIADARTIADANGLNRFRMISGSSITLAQEFDNYEFVNDGTGFACNLAGQSVSNGYFRRCSIIGDDSGTNPARVFLDNCRVNGNTLGDFFQTDCAYGGTQVITEASETYAIDLPRSGGTAPPTVDVNGTLGVTLNISRVSVDFELQGMVSDTVVNIHGEGGEITLNADCTGGTINIYGCFTLTDNSGGAVTVNDNGRIDTLQIGDVVWDEAIADHLTAGSTGNALNAAGAAGDPWSTLLPGAYGAGTAGDIVGNNLDAAVSDTATQTSVDTIDTNVDSILADTGTDGVVLSAATANQIADHTLRRTFANAYASSDGDTVSFRSLLGAEAKLVNRVGVSGTTLTVYREDDSTSFGTQNVTTDANADPITDIDTV